MNSSSLVDGHLKEVLHTGTANRTSLAHEILQRNREPSEEKLPIIPFHDVKRHKWGSLDSHQEQVFDAGLEGVLGSGLEVF